MDRIEIIKAIYPEVYNAAYKLYKYEIKVYELIDDMYGNNTLDNIIKTNEFHNEIENVRKNTLKNTQMNKLAQKYMKYFDVYALVTHDLQNQLGSEMTLGIMERLKDYFKQQL